VSSELDDIVDEEDESLERLALGLLQERPEEFVGTASVCTLHKLFEVGAVLCRVADRVGVTMEFVVRCGICVCPSAGALAASHDLPGLPGPDAASGRGDEANGPGR
jgi:hypothetical protein